MATRSAAAKAATPRRRKPAPAAPAPAAEATKIPVQGARPVKAKLVRDSFSFPKPDYEVLQELKARATRLGRPAKKNEVLRAGVQALAAMGDAAFLATVGGLPAAKPPKAAKPAKAEKAGKAAKPAKATKAATAAA